MPWDELAWQLHDPSEESYNPSGPRVDFKKDDQGYADGKQDARKAPATVQAKMQSLLLGQERYLMCHPGFADLLIVLLGQVKIRGISQEVLDKPAFIWVQICMVLAGPLPFLLGMEHIAPCPGNGASPGRSLDTDRAFCCEPDYSGTEACVVVAEPFHSGTIGSGPR